MKIVNPVGKKLDQGAIFCCAIASDYPQADVHGLIITARCDLANEKAKKYNYIPLVRMEDWLIIDGFPILKSRLFNSILGQVLSSLESVGLYKSFTKNISLAGLAEAIEKIEFSKKKDKVSLLDSIHKLQKMEVISEKMKLLIL